MIERLVIYSPDAFQPYTHAFDYVHGLGHAVAREGVSVTVVGWEGPLELGEGIEERRVKPRSPLRLRADYRRSYGLLGDAAWGLWRIGMERELLGVASRELGNGKSAAALYESFEYIALGRHLKRVVARTPTAAILHDTSFNLQHASPVAAAYKLLVRSSVRHIVRRADVTWVHGERMRANLLANIGGRDLAGRVKVLAYGAPHPEDVQRVTRAAARQSLSLPGDDLVMLAFGTLRSDKRFDLLLRGLARTPEWRLLVAGPEGDLTYDAFLSLAKEAGVADRVRLDRGFVRQAQHPTYFGAADVVVALYHSTAFHESGTAQLARAYLRPVIVAGAADLHDYVARHGIGWAVEPDDLDSFVRAAAEARRAVEPGDGGLVGRIRACAEARSWGAVARQVLAVLDRPAAAA